MASGRGSVQMTEAEIEDFLAANMKVQVATVGPDGAPHLTTLFYVLEDGMLAFWTYGRSQKVVNLRRDPRITCLVEDGTDYAELRGVSIQGTARLVEEYDGKVRLIAVGFGEVATAVNNAAVLVDPEAHVFPGHSSDGS